MRLQSGRVPRIRARPPFPDRPARFDADEPGVLRRKNLAIDAHVSTLEVDLGQESVAARARLVTRGFGRERRLRDFGSPRDRQLG